VQSDEDVGGLEVAVDDPLLVGVLNGLADLDEKIQPLAGRQLVLVAELCDRNASHQFHHEVGPAGVGRAGVEHLGDVRMVHQREGLALGLEAGDHLPGVHPQLDDLEGDLAADRLPLFGQPDRAAAAFAQGLQQFVAANHRAEDFGRRRFHALGFPEPAVRHARSPQQGHYFVAQFRIVTASILQESLALISGQFQRVMEYRFRFGQTFVHHFITCVLIQRGFQPRQLRFQLTQLARNVPRFGIYPGFHPR
jgi:hypothetical protein